VERPRAIGAACSAPEKQALFVGTAKSRSGKVMLTRMLWPGRALEARDGSRRGERGRQWLSRALEIAGDATIPADPGELNQQTRPRQALAALLLVVEMWPFCRVGWKCGPGPRLRGAGAEPSLDRSMEAS